jgi:menaquinone-dependent protoporphyrinogen IX oxidase
MSGYRLARYNRYNLRKRYFGGDMKSLVVYYSLTGKTRLVAQTIAEALNAALVEITEKRPPVMPFVYVSGSFAALTNRKSKINPINVDLKQYERIFVGSPIWASRPVPAVNSFIYRTNFEGRSVVPFFTMGGDNAKTAVTNITTKIDKSQGKVVGSFAITSGRLSDGEIIARAREAIKKYLS